jgi:cell wall assembly regulator SMI1
VSGNLDAKTIRAAVEAEFGAPFDVLELRHAGQSQDVPTAIDVLFFEPRASEGMPEGEWYTYLVTCGLATVEPPVPAERFELVLSVRRRLPREDRHRLARRLAELGTLPFRDRFVLPPEMVLAGVTLPVFERMSHVVLSPYRGLEYLPTRPPVALVEVMPVFPGEADQVRRLGAGEAFFRFSVAEVRRDDPDRREVDLASIAPSSGTPMTPGPAAPDPGALWTDIERALGPAAAKLPGPASEDAIREFLDHIGEEVPQPYLASLRRHDGAELGEHTLLPLAKLLAVRRGLLDQLHVDAFAGRAPKPEIAATRKVEPDWWNASWIPFASRGERLFFIDLFPGRHGTEGQILEWDPREGPVAVTHDSYAAWLADRRDESQQRTP